MTEPGSPDLVDVASGFPGARPVTRNDVARQAGVSSAVVSYVVNRGPKRVAPATEQRVRAAIERLGYQPNLTARALSSGSTQTFGLLVPDLMNPYFAEFAHAIEGAAAGRNHSMLVGNSDSDPTVERRRMADLEARQVDGLLLASVLPHGELADWIGRPRVRRTPTIVLLNSPGPVAGVITVGPDFRAASGHGVRHLIDHGHRRIALLTGSAANLPTEPRELGWRDTLAAAGLPTGPILRGTYTRESGYLLAREMLAAAHPPSAVYAVSDSIAVGVVRAAHELGVRIPDDLAVVSFDGSRETEFSWPPLTCLRQPIEAMAATAVAELLRPDPAAQDSHHVFESPLIIRRSCGCSEG